MPNRRHHLVIALTVFAAAAQEPPAIFSPSHESVVPPGKLRVVGRATGKQQLMLDGKAVAFASPAPGVILAEVAPQPGLHDLALTGEGGESKIRFFSGKEHDGWKMFRPHPPAASCDSCHQVKNNEWALKRASLSPLCHACHDAEKFPASHTHNTGTLADCQNCHAPHGSVSKGHLKVAKETACKQCHS